jgi:hypothetical protein
VSNETESPFEAALATLFVPLARGMVAQGMTVGTATELLKRALVQAVVDDRGEDISDSRISLLTGLHRKDVRRLRHARSNVRKRRSVNAAAAAIGFWASDKTFQGDNGSPRALSRQGTPSAPGFNELIRLAKIDLPPATVLEALLDQGVVEETDTGTYRLLTASLVPREGSEELVAAFQATLSAHLSAATGNLVAKAGEKRFFDRAVRYSHLSDESVAALEQAARDGAVRLLEEINAVAHDLQQSDSAGGASGRFAFGAYILPTPDKDPNSGEDA